MESPIRLIALDLDDTLLRKDLSVSERNKEALHHAERLGIHIVLASGRNYYSMKRYAEELLIHRRGDYLIGSNGAELIRASTGQHVEDLKLEPAFCRAVALDLEAEGYYWQLYMDGRIWCNRMNEWAIMDHEFTGMPLEVIQDFDAILAREQTKILVCGEPARIEPLFASLKQRLEDRAEIVTSKPYFLEILPKGATKGAALTRLSRRLGIPMSSVLAIGDARNDLDMILMAGWGCAPANASPEIKQAARFVSEKTNEEDAVADILEHVVFSL